MSDGRQRTREFAAYGAVAFAALLWSGNHIVGRAIAGHVPPVAMSTLRWVVPVFLLLPFVWRHLRRDWPELRRHWLPVAFLAISGGAVFGALQYVGLQLTTAINVSVLNSVAPVLIVAASAVLFGDPVSVRQIGGIMTSLAGVIVIVCRADFAVLSSMAFNWGDLIIIFNMGVFAIYSAYLRLRPAVHWLTFTFALAVIAAGVSLPAFLLEHLAGHTLQATGETLAALAYVTVFPSVVATIAWNRGVELIGPGRAGAMLHLIALYSAVLASIFLGETLQIYHYVGFALIIGGVWLAARKV
jgi:drug/metabolite transporter (DMT)-like permease